MFQNVAVELKLPEWFEGEKVNKKIFLRWRLFSVPWCGPREKARPKSFATIASMERSIIYDCVNFAHVHCMINTVYV